MKILDFHTHAGDFYRLREDIQELLTRRPMEQGVDITLVLSDPKHLAKYIKSYGVEVGIVFAECGPGTNFSIDSELVANFCKNHEMLIPFGNINPNFHNNVIDEFWKSMKMGVKGFKFYPADHSFDPNTKVMKDIYQLCDTFHLPVVFHTGLTAQKDTEQKFIRPQIFEEIAAENPDLVLILAHGGKPNWHTEAVDMITKFENVYVDTGLVEPKNWETVFPNLEKTSHKILFGSDFPVCGSYKVLLDKISDANIQKEFLENIMYWNGKRLLQKVLDKQIEIMPLLHKKLQSLANNQ